MTTSETGEPRNWRVIQFIRGDLTEQEARAMLRSLPNTYAENSLHEYIESYDGPMTMGRLEPELPTQGL